ncbi:type VI secretion system baseplate subunit TssK [Citrobacter rodentium]|uniref:T6SS protein Cts2M n=2 Tax=Citrobacter rodentium TaxID=67825 RepID=D2TPU3_CITRI|nr:type VI secretion system baseplate subunit TssK [Citrobacter rodentium]KIQ49230.1 T6SS protein Cts2M [Citrobacter rodentium]QBY29792.1 type VI secretion system baseplate subunit TssK [Citrobacter rodentium]UHO32818.1 type VI secretion system baseplate subunit TssK [Citrobacter rodentium NBRC 105723 = DSM 16636]CBG90128.1 T6SS protein Cts2M [Citrobacter rodentium ICC168]HAT8013691.1 type VI secretion system baseplate subunit TssK [Citrobacter rodentium NBRC 105723 = DSM 16636]
MNAIPEMVCWYEGMAMLPQHFQLQSLRNEALAAALAHSANPYFWGVKRMEVDNASLCAGTLRLLRLEAIMPDGMPVDYDISRDPPLEFDCVSLLPALPDSAHTLYLAVPPANRAGIWQPMDGRYRSISSAPLPDLTSGEFPESIPLWQPAPRLVSQHERADFVCLPLIQVVYTEGGFQQNDWFAPTPALDKNSYLIRHTRQLCLQAREKILFLSREMQLAQQNQQTTDWLSLALSLQSLQGALPLLECLLNSGKPHPVDLWRALCLFLGQTAILNEEKTLPLLPGFDYQNMLPAFISLFSLLKAQLASIRRRLLRLNFSSEENHFALSLPKGLNAGDRVTIGVLMPNGCALPAETWLHQCLIASQPFLATLRRQRMHGMNIAPLATQQRGEWETDPAIALFTLTLTAQWFAKEMPLIVAPLHKTDGAPERITLYCQENHDVGHA